jgi:hypothetical protein
MEPFLSRDGRLIVGMRCKCGHAQDMHGHRLADLPDVMIGVPGHGGCLADGCDCQRFTFKEYIYQEEV